MKFVTFADKDTECCYNASHIIRVIWREGTNVIHIETVNKSFTHIFGDAYTAKFTYHNNIMRNLIQEEV